MLKFFKSNSNNSLKITRNEHFFQIRCFLKPVLCLHCNDFIWGSGFTGYCCPKCSKCVHNKCKSFIEDSACLSNDQITIEKNSVTTLNPIKSWSLDLVKEWLAVVNLHIYALKFENKKIDGEKLLSINTEILIEMKICDSWNQTAILEAKNELIRKADLNSSNSYITQIISEDNEGKKNYKKHQYKADQHQFIRHTFSNSTNCVMCKLPLLGIIHQGLQCQICGLICHRQCSHLGLPECKPNPEVFNPCKKLVFGANLIDLMTEAEGLEAPIILVKLFKNIEERALKNNEDLYEVYRSSVEADKIEKIKDLINQNGFEHLDLNDYDLKTVAELTKSFLRDLEDTVIPECLFEQLVSLIQLVKKDDLLSILNQNMHPLNIKCLKFILLHIIWIWNYQHKSNSCHFIPDKLFHIFRAILLRPKWENITQVVYNREQQILIIQRLILDIDWGVKLPQNKITHRPKKKSSEPDLISLPLLNQKKNKPQYIKSLSVCEEISDWNTKKVYTVFCEIFLTIESLTKNFKILESQIVKNEENLEESKICLSANNKVIDLYTNQLDEIDRFLNANDAKRSKSCSSTQMLVSKMVKMNLKNEETTNDEDKKLEIFMIENKKKIDQRITDLNVKVEKLKAKIDNIKDSRNKLQIEMDKLMPELLESRSKRDNYYVSLIRRGESDDTIRETVKKISNIDLDESFDARKSSIDSISGIFSIK